MVIAVDVEYEDLEYTVNTDGRGCVYLYDGKPFSGIAVERFVDGTLRCEFTFRNGVEHGTIKEYYQSGKIKSYELRIDGKVRGPATEWFPNGGVKKIQEYGLHGKLRSRTYNEAGKLIAEEDFGERGGSRKRIYDQLGNLTKEVVFPEPLPILEIIPSLRPEQRHILAFGLAELLAPVPETLATTPTASILQSLREALRAWLEGEHQSFNAPDALTQLEQTLDAKVTNPDTKAFFVKRSVILLEYAIRATFEHEDNSYCFEAVKSAHETCSSMDYHTRHCKALVGQFGDRACNSSRIRFLNEIISACGTDYSMVPRIETVFVLTAQLQVPIREAARALRESLA